MTSPIQVAIPLGFISFIVLVENCTVLFLVYRNRHMRTFTNGFVVSLAISDILTGMVIFFQYLIGFQNAIVINVVYAVVLICGAANLTAVTMDRYIAITRPFDYDSLMEKYFKYIVVTTWFVSIILAILPLCWYGDISRRYHKIYIFFVIGLGVVAPYIFILFANIKIYSIVKLSIRKEKRTLSGISQDKGKHCKVSMKKMFSEAKVAKVFACTALAFVISWFPVLYYTIAAALGYFNFIPNILLQLSPFFLALGSLANPIIYSFMKPDFKIAVRLFLCKNKFKAFGGDSCAVYTRAKRNSTNRNSYFSVTVSGALESMSNSQVPYM